MQIRDNGASVKHNEDINEKLRALVNCNSEAARGVIRNKIKKPSRHQTSLRIINPAAHNLFGNFAKKS